MEHSRVPPLYTDSESDLSERHHPRPHSTVLVSMHAAAIATQPNDRVLKQPRLPLISTPATTADIKQTLHVLCDNGMH
jgi:hypothetical protein